MDPVTILEPKDPIVHKPITVKTMLEKKFRWMTLGGQYDWTAKTYPPEARPAFPADIQDLLGRLFPGMDAQAAIVNCYSPGDTLSVHRDVSEECDRGLVSISLGCEGIFIIGSEDGTSTATLKLGSGDAVYMTGSARFAWHAVPMILADTCPEWLWTWPTMGSGDSRYSLWRGWMANKRINLNVRQITEKHSTALDWGGEHCSGSGSGLS